MELNLVSRACTLFREVNADSFGICGLIPSRQNRRGAEGRGEKKREGEEKGKEKERGRKEEEEERGTSGSSKMSSRGQEGLGHPITDVFETESI